MYTGIIVTNDLAGLPAIVNSFKDYVNFDIICTTLYATFWIGSTNHKVFLVNKECEDFEKNFEKLERHANDFNPTVVIIQFKKDEPISVIQDKHFLRRQK